MDAQIFVRLVMMISGFQTTLQGMDVFYGRIESEMSGKIFNMIELVCSKLSKYQEDELNLEFLIQ